MVIIIMTNLEGSCDIKIEIFKSWNFVGSKSTGFENSLRFAQSVTVSEKTAILANFGRKLAAKCPF